jgi:hypothetical protein
MSKLGVWVVMVSMGKSPAIYQSLPAASSPLRLHTWGHALDSEVQ